MPSSRSVTATGGACSLTTVRSSIRPAPARHGCPSPSSAGPSRASCGASPRNAAVPLVDRVSVIRTPSTDTVSVQWDRDSRGSSRRTSEPAARPTVRRPRWTGTTRPASGPAVTTSSSRWGVTVGAGAAAPEPTVSTAPSSNGGRPTVASGSRSVPPALTHVPCPPTCCPPGPFPAAAGSGTRSRTARRAVPPGHRTTSSWVRGGSAVACTTVHLSLTAASCHEHRPGDRPDRATGDHAAPGRCPRAGCADICGQTPSVHRSGPHL